MDYAYGRFQTSSVGIPTARRVAMSVEHPAIVPHGTSSRSSNLLGSRLKVSF